MSFLLCKYGQKTKILMVRIPLHAHWLSSIKVCSRTYYRIEHAALRQTYSA